jgi:hypothetical protein
MKKYLLLLIVVVVLSLFACNKYEYGPSVSLRTKTGRISNTWVVEAAYINKVVQPAGTYKKEVVIEKSGALIKTDTLLSSMGTDTIITKEGLWEFDRNVENLLVLFADNSGVQEAQIWRILKLTSDEFWYEERDNYDLIEIHLKEKEL